MLKKIAIVLLSVLICSSLKADQTKTVFNPYTGKFDFITALTTNSIVAGSGVTTTCTAGACTINSSLPLPGGATNYIQNRSTLQSGATAYPDFLYVGTSATISGPLYVGNSTGLSSGTDGTLSLMIPSITTLFKVFPFGGQPTISFRFQNDAAYEIGQLDASDFRIMNNGTIMADFVGGGLRVGTFDGLYNGSPKLVVGGTIQSTDLTASQFIKTDGSKNLVSYDLLNASQTWTGFQNESSSVTFSGSVYISSSVSASGSVGSSGQFLTSGGYGTTPTWTTAAGSGGGASTLAVYTGSLAQMLVQVSSPTSSLNLDQSTLSGSLTGASTAYISVQAGISSPTGSFTIGSTSTVILANCAANCTQTLPTAVGIGGKRYAIQMQNASSVVFTIATTGGQTINGNASYIVSVASTTVDLISDNANWQIE